jgi:isoleucyl-tRNA synthetase
VQKTFLKGEYAQDKIAAYQTLYTCLLTVSKLEPIAPFLWTSFTDLTLTTQSEKFDSVHLSEFPKYVENFVNKSLESKMQKAQTISSLVLSPVKK